MNHSDLSTLGSGFRDEALGSQSVFRCAMRALSQPGQRVLVAHDADVPAHAHPASAAMMLATLDSDCTLWLSPKLANGDAAKWLHFHTGCHIVNQAQEAQFVWVALGDDVPALAGLAQGSDSYPDQSATCVLDVAELSDAPVGGGYWTLTGPGIQTSQALQVHGLSSDFVAQWAANHSRFPSGVDVFLASPQHLVGLPRTCAIAPMGDH